MYFISSASLVQGHPDLSRLDSSLKEFHSYKKSAISWRNINQHKAVRTKGLVFLSQGSIVRDRNTGEGVECQTLQECQLKIYFQLQFSFEFHQQKKSSLKIWEYQNEVGANHHDVFQLGHRAFLLQKCVLN